MQKKQKAQAMTYFMVVQLNDYEFKMILCYDYTQTKNQSKGNHGGLVEITTKKKKQ